MKMIQYRVAVKLLGEDLTVESSDPIPVFEEIESLDRWLPDHFEGVDEKTAEKERVEAFEDAVASLVVQTARAFRWRSTWLLKIPFKHPFEKYVGKADVVVTKPEGTIRFQRRKDADRLTLKQVRNAEEFSP